MSEKPNLAERIRESAEERRGRQVFCPDHPAVRAAKRYCERTGKNWNIGIGGRCELGKRAIKQWLYEATAPVRHAWRYAVGKWVIITSCVLVLIALGLVYVPLVTLGVVVIVVGTALVVISGFFGHETALGELPEDTAGRVLTVIGWTLGLPIALVFFTGTKLVNRRNWWKIKLVLGKIFSGLAILLVVAFVGLLVTFLIGSGAWAGALLVLGGVVALVGLIVGVVYIALKIGKYRSYRRDQIEAERRKDPAVQALALEKLMPLLRKTYEDQKFYRSSYALYGSLPSFDDWLQRFKATLWEFGYRWTDLLQQGGSWSDLADQLEFLQTQRPPVIQGEFTLFISRLQDLAKSEVTPRKRRSIQRKQAISFVAATLFALKSSVCPNVDLPAWDEVDAQANY